MSEQLFDVVFFGIIQPGKDKELVMQNMASLFKTDAGKLAPYFTGGRKVIKGKINADTAEKYRTALENVGLVIKVEPCEKEPTDAETGQTAVSVKASATGSDNFTIAPPGVDIIENPVEVPAQKIADISNLTMAEVGADVIENPVEVTAQKISDISGITMAEAGSNVLEHPRAVSAQKIEDISQISLAEAGADIIARPKPVDIADIPDFSALSLCNE